jgi:hypothetical protein
MITLYTFGPYFGLPDPSPFVMKAEVLLKMAGLPYRTDTTAFGKAPKGSFPISTTMARLSPTPPSSACTSRRSMASTSTPAFPYPSAALPGFSKRCARTISIGQGCMCAGWSTRISTKAPRQFFDAAVAPLRPLVVTLARRQFRRNLWGRGMGRHTLAEMEQLATRDIDAIADLLAGKPYLMGLVPCGADAATFPFMAHALCPLF